jgi:uncharacterized membrane protein
MVTRAADRERLTERHQHPGRIEGLTDGVFAVAMTLLVLGLVVNGREGTAAQHSGKDLWRAFIEQSIGWKFLWFLASFAVTSFWYVGHMLILWTIDRVNRVAVWINIGFFVPIVLVPFTTSLVGDFPHATLAGTLYVLDVLAISLMLDLLWSYCIRKHFVSERTTPEISQAIGRRLRFVTILLLFDSMVAWFFPYIAVGAILLTMLYIASTAGSRLIVEE